MKRIACFATVVLVASLVAGSAIAAGGRKIEKKMPPSLDDPIAIAVLAEQLITYGEKESDPLALILAAKMKRSVVVTEKNTGAIASDTAKELLDKAKAMSGERSEIVALADDAMKIASRGVMENVQQIREIVRGRGTYRIPLTFKGGEFTSVAVLLDQGASGKREEYDLDMYIHSMNGHAVCVREGPGIPEMCPVTPIRNEKFVIDLVNRTNLDTPFVLLFR